MNKYDGYPEWEDENDDLYESEESVAAGLGLIIDEDGNWIPDDY